MLEAAAYLSRFPFRTVITQIQSMQIHKHTNTKYANTQTHKYISKLFFPLQAARTEEDRWHPEP